ncbi:MAG: DUF523 and DUF1722 domain-containing protein [Deltaproteobacteria bacterium]|nr:DUF523 and DUF1722 domain-containing protein [Deltaproteobacteria bacterium]
MLRLPTPSDSDPVSPPARIAPALTPGRVRLLISACLLGEHVRYDGQHKYDPFLVETLGRFVEWVRVCPEVDCGMPTPRPSMHLVGDPHSPRLVSRLGVDLTARMQRFAEAQVERYAGLGLCGYVCKKDSPSSGMARVKVYDEEGKGALRNGVGIFTRTFMERYPLIPVEEEGRLHDPELRERFIERVFCVRRWLDLLQGGMHRGRLVDFHADHKYLVLSHGRAGYAALGQLVAAAKQHRPADLYRAYHEGFMAALAQPATRKKITDVLQHMLGYFKRELSKDEKSEMLETAEAYRRSLVPLIVPVTLLKHYVRKYEVAYLQRQVFLSPYPAELMLRNHV